MKNLFKLLVLVFIATTVLSSCSKDDDPADNDLFVGTYKGNITYRTDGVSKQNENGSVTVVKVGNDYSFKFSDDIPDINGVTFKKDANSAVSIGDETKSIKITASSLNIGYTTDGKFWTASCKR